MTDQLDANSLDRFSSITKIAGSLVLLVGGPLSALITETIPNLRLDRIIKYIRILEERLERLEKDEIDKFQTDPEKVDLVESGGYLAARSTSSERIERITEIGYLQWRIRIGGVYDFKLLRRQALPVFQPPEQDVRIEQGSHCFRASQSVSGTVGDTMSPLMITVFFRLFRLSWG